MSIDVILRPIYCICKPTTKSFFVLPRPPDANGASAFLSQYNLALDPSKLPHYWVICLERWNYVEWRSTMCDFWIWIYESETISWRISNCLFSHEIGLMDFGGGIFWNVSVHRLGPSKCLCFNMEEDRVGKLPLPKVLIKLGRCEKIKY